MWLGAAGGGGCWITNSSQILSSTNTHTHTIYLKENLLYSSFEIIYSKSYKWILTNTYEEIEQLAVKSINLQCT